jgi:8-oxo-dGTP pyrophosphatase MutT (NUDIX family)
MSFSALASEPYSLHAVWRYVDPATSYRRRSGETNLQRVWAHPLRESSGTLEEATAREVWEEAGVKLVCRDLTLRGVTTLTELQQVYVHFSAKTRDSTCRAGDESLDAMFFKPRDIPWDRLAFPSVAQDIRQFLNERVTGHTRVRLTCES